MTCDYCEDNTPGVYLVTVKDSRGQTVPSFVNIAVCEDHIEEVDASIQMVNLTKKDGQFTLTKTRITT